MSSFAILSSISEPDHADLSKKVVRIEVVTPLTFRLQIFTNLFGMITPSSSALRLCISDVVDEDGKINQRFQATEPGAKTASQLSG